MTRFLAHALALAGLLLMSGCQLNRSAAGAPDTNIAGNDQSVAASTTSTGTGTGDHSDQATIQLHLAALAQQIDQMEDQLGHGKGALRNGASFSVDNNGHESLLERLRRLQKELADAKNQITAQDKLISDLRSDLTTSKNQGAGLAEQADALAHVRDNLVTARQELADRQARLAGVNDQLALSELARLHAEKSYYQIAGNLLRLAPGQTQELVDLQELVRSQVKELHPAGNQDVK